MNEGLTQTEQDLVEMLDKQAHTELMLGEKINSTLLNKAIEMIHTIAKERAYWQFKAECYQKDLTKLNAEIDKLYEDKWTDKGDYE
jgi:hypothetical protein